MVGDSRCIDTEAGFVCPISEELCLRSIMSETVSTERQGLLYTALFCLEAGVLLQDLTYYVPVAL